MQFHLTSTQMDDMNQQNFSGSWDTVSKDHVGYATDFPVVNDSGPDDECRARLPGSSA